MSRHTLDLIAFEAVTPLYFDRVESGEYAADIQTTQPDSGAPYVETQFVQQADHRLTCTLRQLRTLLENFALNGATCIETGKALTAVAMYGRKLAACDAHSTATGSVHARWRSTKARAFVTGISASGTGNAVANVTVVCLSADGQAEPVAMTVNNAAIAPASRLADEEFTLFDLTIGGTSIAGDMIESVNFDTGIRYEVARGIHPQAVDVVVTKSAPMLTITLQNTALPQSLFSGGLSSLVAAESGNTVVRYRNRASELDNEVHLSLSMAGQIRLGQPFSAGGSRPGTTQIIVTGLGTVSALPFAIATDVNLS